MSRGSFDGLRVGADGDPRKCAKFVIGKKSAVGDRPATRKHERPLSWESLPFATVPVVTSEDAQAQCTRVSSVMIPILPRTEMILYSSWRYGAKTESLPSQTMIWLCS